MTQPQLPFTSPLGIQAYLQSRGLEIVEDGIVRWKLDSTQHPRGWATRKKVYNAAAAIFLDFFM